MKSYSSFLKPIQHWFRLALSDTVSTYLSLLSFFPVDFDKITLFEGFDYCQADTDLHNRFERSLPITMLTETFWLGFFHKSLRN